MKELSLRNLTGFESCAQFRRKEGDSLRQVVPTYAWKNGEIDISGDLPVNPLALVG